MNISLKRLEDDERDVEFTFNIRNDNFEFFGNPNKVTRDQHLVWFSKTLNDESKLFFIIMLDHAKRIGTCSLTTNGGDTGEIGNIVIDIDYRRNGYGNWAMARLENLARILGYSSVTLEVRSNNPKAIAFYQSIGFTLQNTMLLASKKLN